MDLSQFLPPDIIHAHTLNNSFHSLNAFAKGNHTAA